MAKSSSCGERPSGSSLAGGAAVYLGSNILNGAIPLLLLPILTRYLSTEEYGVAGMYQMAISLLAAFTGLAIAGAANKAYVPWLFERLKRNDSAVDRVIVRGTHIYFSAALVVAAAIAWAGPWFIPWFAGEGYVQASGVLGWLALGQAFNAMYLMVTSYAFYAHSTGKLSLATVLSGSLHLVLAYYLVRMLGINGVGIAYAVSMGIRFLLTWWLAQRVHPMPWFAGAGIDGTRSSP